MCNLWSLGYEWSWVHFTVLWHALPASISWHQQNLIWRIACMGIFIVQVMGYPSVYNRWALTSRGTLYPLTSHMQKLRCSHLWLSVSVTKHDNGSMGNWGVITWVLRGKKKAPCPWSYTVKILINVISTQVVYSIFIRCTKIIHYYEITLQSIY